MTGVADSGEPARTRLEYGVQIEWCNAFPGEPAQVVTFQQRRQAENFARSYDPWTNPGRGASKVDVVERVVLETYQDWEICT